MLKVNRIRAHIRKDQVFKRIFVCKNSFSVLLRIIHIHTEIEMIVLIFVDDAGIPTSPAPTPFRETPGEVTKYHLINSITTKFKIHSV